MKRILSDYYKHYLNVIISNILLLVFITIMYVLNDFSLENTWDKVIIVIYAIAFALGMWALIDSFITTPFRLKKQLAIMTENERNDILAQYPDAKCADGHRYMDKHFVFFSAHRIYLLRYADIKATELARTRLTLTVNGHKKPIHMPFPEYGTNAVALAFLRSKNPDLKIIRKEAS